MPKPLNGLANNWYGTRVVIGKRRRSHEWHIRPPLPGDIAYLSNISGHDNLIKTATLQCSLYRPRNHGLATKGFNVLPRYALAATAGWNNSQLHARDFFNARTTSSCSASDNVAYIGRLIPHARLFRL
jgi:hypothetical protein